MKAPLCSRCWRPHSMASLCSARGGGISPLWGGATEEQRIADRAERIAIDHFLRLRERRTARLMRPPSTRIRDGEQ